MADLAQLGFEVETKGFDEAQSKAENLQSTLKDTAKTADDFNERRPQSIRALRLRAGFKNRLRMNVPRPGPYILALASLGRESKMLFPSKEHQLCCDADTSPGYFPSPSKRRQLELVVKIRHFESDEV